MSWTIINKEAKLALLLKYILYMYYLVYFKKDLLKIQTLFDFDYVFNAITIAYAKKLGFQICKTNVEAQKIVSFSLIIYKIVITRFQVLDQLARACFYQKIFLLSNINKNIILKLIFLTLNNANILFTNQKFI